MRLLGVICAACFASAVGAEEGLLYLKNEPVGRIASQGSALQIEGKIDFKTAVVSVTGPNGYRASQAQKEAKGAIDLKAFGSLPDGLYQLEIVTKGEQQTELVSPPLNNGRGKDELRKRGARVAVSGQFRVLKGEIVLLKGDFDRGGDRDEL